MQPARILKQRYVHNHLHRCRGQRYIFDHRPRIHHHHRIIPLRRHLHHSRRLQNSQQHHHHHLSSALAISLSLNSKTHHHILSRKLAHPQRTLTPTPILKNRPRPRRPPRRLRPRRPRPPPLPPHQTYVHFGAHSPCLAQKDLQDMLLKEEEEYLSSGINSATPLPP